MITRLDINDFDFTEKMMGVTLTNELPNSAVSTGVRVYIPVLMNCIKIGEPKETVGKSLGSTIFKNDHRCKPSASSTVKRQNYIRVKKERNANLAQILMSKNNGFCIPKDTKLQISFTHGKISSALFNTDVEFQ